MEAWAAVSMVTSIFECGGGFIRDLLTDDNSTTHSNCKLSFQAQLNTGGMKNKKTEWPWTKGGKAYMTDKGKLPLTVKQIESFFANPTHHCKSFGQALYALCCEMGRKLKFSNIDCEQLKQNFGFWQHQNKTGFFGFPPIDSELF